MLFGFFCFRQECNKAQKHLYLIYSCHFCKLLPCKQKYFDGLVFIEMVNTLNEGRECVATLWLLCSWVGGGEEAEEFPAWTTFKDLCNQMHPYITSGSQQPVAMR